MIKAVKDLYRTPDFEGEALCRPLKNYHKTLTDKINNSKGYVKVAWVIAQIVTGIVLYPVFAIVAGIGMFFKLFYIKEAKARNEAIISVDLPSDLVALKCGGFGVYSRDGKITAGYRTTEIGTFQLNKDDPEMQTKTDEIVAAIRAQSAQFRIVQKTIQTILPSEHLPAGILYTLYTVDPIV